MSKGGGREAAKTAFKALGVPLPSHGCKYEMEEAVEIILKFPYRSRQRGAVINLMANGGYIAGRRSTLCKFVRKAENARNKMNVQQTTAKDKASLLGLGYEGDYVRRGIRGNVSRKGSIVLHVFPTSSIHYNPRSIISSATIDICSLIGNTDIAAKIDPAMQNDSNVNINYSVSKAWKQLCKKESLLPLKWDRSKIDESERLGERITKLYFDPVTYPPPKYELECDNIVFGHLKNYIELSAKRCGSPVVCNGNGHHPNERRFRCRRWYRRRNQQNKDRVYNKVSCTFTFSVKWNHFGYYIPLIENRHQWHNYGCGWHCC